MVQILDFGCGNRKLPGAVGIDINPDTDADIVHDLNKFPYPFEDSTFDEISADNVIEHLDNIIAVMEELHRISKPGAVIRIMVPYFRAKWAFIDPTHRHFFTVESFSYFDPEHIHNKLYNYSKAKFKIEKVLFNEGLVHQGIFRLFMDPFKTIANKYPLRYERYLSHLLPLDELTFILRTVK
jgi:SAM-dependent methyltransferase